MANYDALSIQARPRDFRQIAALAVSANVTPTRRAGLHAPSFAGSISLNTLPVTEVKGREATWN